MEIQMDLIDNWHDIMISKMEAEDIQYLHTSDKKNLIIKYFTYLRKVGDNPRPRTVNLSNEFECPSDFKDGLDICLMVR